MAGSKPRIKAKPRGGFRSTAEYHTAQYLNNVEVSYEYETCKIPYTRPETQHTYTPDFILPNGIMIEVKGELTLEDRKKHLLIKDQHPDLDIRFAFVNPKRYINKNKKTNYASWARKYGFKYCTSPVIPIEWLEEGGLITINKDFIL